MNANDQQSDCHELYDAAPCGLLVTARDGTIEQVNQTFCNWVGFPKSALIGAKKLQDLLTVGGKIFHQTHWMPLLQIQGSVAEIALEMVHADQRKIPMLMNAIRRERKGVVTHEIATFISEDRRAYEQQVVHSRTLAEHALAEQLRIQQALEQAQERLRLAVQATQLCLWDDDGRPGGRIFDERTALLLGYPTPRPISAEEFAAAAHASNGAFPLYGHEGSNELYRHEYRIKGVDGIERIVLDTGRALPTAEDPDKHVGVLQDITEISQQRIAAEHRALFAQQMVGIVSHDLRNPLLAISLSAEMLLVAGLDARQSRFAGVILKAAKRAQRMVNDLLDFTTARLGHGITVNKTVLDLQVMVARCVEELAASFPGHVIRHEHQGSGLCCADADRLAQLIGNLVGNAVKYGASEGAITVSSSVQPHVFSVAVHNDGTPIPHDLIAHLFEPMSRGEHVQDTDRSVGLGLYIVREIARGHGGEVTVHSTADAGTTFTLVMPREVD